MKRFRVPIQIGLATALLLGILIGVFGKHLAIGAEFLLAWVQSLGPLGPVVMVLSYVLCCVLSIPGTPLTLGCGFLFGLMEGTLVAAIGSAMGASIAFFVGRTAARGWIRAKVGRKQRFRRLDRAAKHHGFTIVLLTRMSPIFPFNLLNYMYGLTSVRFRDYLGATLIGVFPVSLLYVYVGTLMKTLADVAAGRMDKEALQPWVMIAGLVLTTTAVVLLAVLAKRMLDKAMAPLPSRLTPAIDPLPEDDRELNQ